ncbi:uncharacterized protein LOC126896158 isoform X2 [Daktulosphaira vitifoliae]|uniref:uncharacterized protein LOC126896158 isoform X2 n=1 Tax=Daktulosphaira vitifoliae TaxID=58002 RepID=UPI0021A9E400|nr:uncharacterized protein LOC126896158 isoform X2 [Daktulosphaira vitifoliae]
MFFFAELYAHPNKINSKFANLLRLLCFTAVDELESGKNIDTESVQYFDIGNDVKEEGTCGICLEEKESVTLIPCEHKFCNTCINISLYKYELNKCSVCRQEFTSTEGLKTIPILDYKKSRFIGLVDYEQGKDPYVRMKQPIDDEIIRLKRKIAQGIISDGYLIARYYYLRQSEEPDQELIEDILRLEKFNKESIRKLKICIENCKKGFHEYLLYSDLFIIELDENERQMLFKYYYRKKKDPTVELKNRIEYIRFPGKTYEHIN